MFLGISSEVWRERRDRQKDRLENANVDDVIEFERNKVVTFCMVDSVSFRLINNTNSKSTRTE